MRSTQLHKMETVEHSTSTSKLYLSSVPEEMFLTLSGNVSKQVLTGSLQPNLEDLNLRMMSCSVAATTKYSCFRRSSFPSKNYTHTV